MANANIGALALNQQNIIAPPVNGATYPFSLGTAPQQVLGLDPQRRKVMFHNPGTDVIIYVCQARDANGNPLTPGPNGGSFAVYPGSLWTYTGDGSGTPWLAAAASGADNPLTVVASQMP